MSVNSDTDEIIEDNFDDPDGVFDLSGNLFPSRNTMRYCTCDEGWGGADC